MIHLSAEDTRACAVVLGVIEAEIRKLPQASQVREVFQDWADDLRSDPPGWVPSTPRLEGSGD